METAVLEQQQKKRNCKIKGKLKDKNKIEYVKKMFKDGREALTKERTKDYRDAERH